jgi:hypothetical protein
MSQSEEDRSEDSQGFRVEDRRRFSETGARRESAGDEAEAPAASATAAQSEPKERDEPSGEQYRSGGEAVPGDIDFSSFVVGLATQAIMFMGLAPDPGSGTVHRDLAQAKSLIDILAMLHDKTRGNLDEDEDTMMEEMLYELRMQYVRALRGEDEPPQSGENG